MVIVSTAYGCNARRESQPANTSAHKSGRVVLLTRGSCPLAPTMRSRLDNAMRGLKIKSSYEVLDLDTLQPSDIRRGYPTPTLLVDDRDLFGLPEPQPPLPEPT
jgi:hypothetical protein